MKGTTISSKSKTNWNKLSKLKDSEIDTSDIGELDEEFFRRAEIRLPLPKKMISLRLDEDILSWFKKSGPGYQTRINEVLKTYIRAKSTRKMAR